MDGASEGLLLDEEVLAQAPVERRSGLEVARARLVRLGARSLTDGELVGLLSGAERERDVAALLGDGLHALLTEPIESLLERRGLDADGVARLLAAAELARRLGHTRDERPRLATPHDIHEFARPLLFGLRREEFHVLCLNSRNVLLRHQRVAEGSVDQCHVDPREVLAPAIACRATGLVVVHNHPSGDPEPSVLDVTLTRQLRDGAKLLCVKLLDHLVLGDRGYVSMLARGLLGPEERPWAPRLFERDVR